EVGGFDFFPYFKAARIVSGDYYDFIPIASNLMGFTVADVSGKGLPGSLIMSMARSVLRFESQQNPFPGLVLRHVSSVLLKDLKPGFFITMVYAILNTTSKVLSISSAGHNPVLLFRKSEGEIQELKPRGVGIGIGDELFFEKHLFEEKFFLQQGDIFFMYTDGLTEAMNEAEEEFGLERVKEIILENSDKSSKKIVEEIIKDVESFRKDALQNDDITILCLKTK
ncbi:MAG: PP2C family protein-serine/threonine phosphatase, partial [bacterium]|nr:PP2C family protein-serine/threonine phosphatase [bacterium]